MKGILGRKLGMTQVFTIEGTLIPVTVVEVKPNVVLQKKTKDVDGYEAVQLGYEDVKEQRSNKPAIGHAKKANTAPKKFIKEFNYDEMLSPEGFNNMLKRLDREISFKNAQRKKELDEINKAKRQRLQKKYGKNYKSFNDIDLRDIANAYGIDGKRQGDRMIVSCPFHNDTHPSSVVFKERSYCSTCNMTLNYYDFISKLEGTEDKDKIMQIAREFLR